MASPAATAVEKRDPQQLLKDDLGKIKVALEQILPKHVTADRMIKVVLSATARNPDLLKCTRASIVRAVMQSAELGLEIGGLLGEAYLVPYNVKVKYTDDEGRPQERWEKQAQCIIGYRGFIKLARQSGEIDAIDAHPVYDGDVFEVNFAESTILHSPGDLTRNREECKILAFYAMARYRRGFKQIDVMTLGEVEKVRKRSKAADGGPWVTDYVEMGRKSVVRRLAKYLDLSPEVRRAIELETEHESRERSGDIDIPMVDGTVTEVADATQASAPAPADPKDDGRRIKLHKHQKPQADAHTANAAPQAAQQAQGSASPAAASSDAHTTPAPAASQQSKKQRTSEPEPPFGSDDQATQEKPARDWDADGTAIWKRINDAATLDALDEIAQDAAEFMRLAPANLVRPVKALLDERRGKLGG